MGRRAASASPASRLARQAADAALPARQAGAGDARRCRRVRRAADQSAGAAGSLRRDPVDARLSLQSLPVRGFSARHRLSRLRRRLPTAPELPLALGARVLDRRRGDDRNRRRVFGAASRQRQPRNRHSHRRARASRSRAARRWMPSRAHACRRSTCPDARSRCCPRPSSNASRWLAATAPSRVIAVRRNGARRHAARQHDASRARADRRQSAPRRHRRAVSRRAPRLANPNGPTSCASLWRLAQKLEAARGKADVQRVDYSFLVDWDAAPDGKVTIVPRPRGSPLDKLVAELMIHVNSTWGRLLADAGRAGALPHATGRQGAG